MSAPFNNLPNVQGNYWTPSEIQSFFAFCPMGFFYYLPQEDEVRLDGQIIILRSLGVGGFVCYNKIMTKQDLKKFKERLEKTKEELENSLSTFATKDPNLKGDWDSKYPKFRTDLNVDLETEADEVGEYLVRLPVEHSYELRVQAISEALDRIKKGTYGKCGKCKSNVPKKRLEAYPEAKFCLKCQE